MQINFEGIGFRYRRLIKSIYEKALILTENDGSCIEITVTGVGKDRIRQLNNEHRKVDRATDVLSFPMLDITYPQKVNDFVDDILPDGSIYIGDVVICKQVAKMQAKEYGHSLKREMAFLALHGLLHVLGYDHIEKEDEAVMMAKSEEILNSMNIKRGKHV